VYNEVYRSWQTALRRLNVGTPRLKTEDVQEQEEDFLNATADTTRKRLIPDQTACSLEYHIIRCWLHEAFWLICTSPEKTDTEIWLTNTVSGLTRTLHFIQGRNPA